MHHTKDANDLLVEIRDGALAALKRSRRRAEEIAAKTNTALILAVDGKPVRVAPPQDAPLP